ncbi:MAG: TonB-dependent receptor [Ignavibacterium sp.]|nr:TonB-dependent receptor [Ignavibacterium sp.]
MKLLLISVLLTFNSFSQNIDSLHFQLIGNDTIKITDSTIVIPIDSVIILNYGSLDNQSTFISRKDIVKSNYRFVGDLLNEYPLTFQRDFGFVGYPNDVLLFGNGSEFVNWMIDGIPSNERIGKSFNLNLVQTDDIDSIEIIPLPRGFLYGSYIFPVSANYITRDFIPPKPYSRIRYIQGPDREASVDVNFHALLSKKLLLSFDISNRIKDSTYRNTEFSLWQIKTKLKYFLSNEINILATFNYNDYKLGFNGGIDVDSIRKLTDDINTILYDDFLAPIVFPNGEMKTLQHFPKLSILTNFFPWLKSDLNLYYRYSKYDSRSDIQKNNKEDIYGFSIRNKFFVRNFEFNLLFDYEKINQSTEYLDDRIFTYADLVYNYDRNIFSIGGIITTKLLRDKLNISFFYKHSAYQDKYYSNFIIDKPIVTQQVFPSDLSNNGTGADVTFKFNDYIRIYVGSSFINNYYSNDSKESLLFQSGLNYQNEFLSANIIYFINEYGSGSNYYPQYLHTYQTGNVDGVGLSLKAKYNFLLIELKSSKYNSRSGDLISTPEFSSRTGLFFNDYLFNNNLDLKAGVVFTFTGKQKYQSLRFGLVEVSPVTRIDLSIAGEIRKAATVYFVLENLLDKKYYITPYYPMPERNFRFGIAWEFLD